MAQSNSSGFILLGFSDLSSQLQLFLCVGSLIVYLLTLLGNIVICGIITLDPSLHTPMYYFLKNLSLVEVMFTTVIVPKMLTIFLLADKFISFTGCAVQLFFFLVLGVVDCYILMVMALDRYIAICLPLRYMTIMNKSKCAKLILTIWIIGITFSSGHTMFIFHLPFCKSHVIYHFFCDIPPLLRLSCADTFVNEIVTTAAGIAFLLLPLLLILISYTFVIVKIARMKSAEGRNKAVSTCSSHITSVTLFYGAAMLDYLQPKSSYSIGRERVFAVFYVFVIPMLNPLIYSLRNKEVKQAIRKQLARNVFSMLS